MNYVEIGWRKQQKYKFEFGTLAHIQNLSLKMAKFYFLFLDSDFDYDCLITRTNLGIDSIKLDCDLEQVLYEVYGCKFGKSI